MDEIIGAAETFGVAGPDPWMQGRIAAEKGERCTVPVWLLPGDQDEWMDGFLSYGLIP